MRPKIVSTAEATPSNVQHDKPCGDCPWRRRSVVGWLGGLTPEQWVLEAQSEAQIVCHTVVGEPQPQCVGAAIYRANTCKSPRNKSARCSAYLKENWSVPE